MRKTKLENESKNAKQQGEMCYAVARNSAVEFCGFCASILAFFLLWSNFACDASTAALLESRDGKRDRLAAVYFSNGKVLTGNISMTAGRSFKLNIPKAGKLKTTDMITGEDVQYGKVRRFTLGPVREIRFYPEREEMRRKWKFIEKTKYDEKTAQADYTPAAKEYSGQPYPLRYLAATVIFNSGESLQGHLYTTTLYLETDERTHKLVLRSKQRGAEGTTLDDLVYVRNIKLLDEGKQFAAKLIMKFTDMRFGRDDAVQAVTKESLTPIPTKLTEQDDTCIVESAFGEEIYLAARINGKYIVGWPGEQDKKLFALAKDHIARHRDFYNDRQLLAVLERPEQGEVLTLVNLRRRVAPTHFGKIGGEWDKERGTLVEPWRLSIWRWKYDKTNRELTLTARGTFFRVILLPKDATPEAVISEKLWQLQYDGDTVIVGQGRDKNLEGTEP